jgi:hypothetical protein
LSHGTWLWHLRSMWQQQPKIMVMQNMNIDCCFSHCPTKLHYLFWKVRDQKEMSTEFLYDYVVCCWEIEMKRIREKFVWWLDNSSQGTVLVQNYWVSGLCPSSGILNTRKYNLLENWICFHPQVRGRRHLLSSVREKKLNSITRQSPEIQQFWVLYTVVLQILPTVFMSSP